MLTTFFLKLGLHPNYTKLTTKQEIVQAKKVNNKIETTAKNYLNLNCTSQEWGLLGVTRVTNSQGVTQSYFLKAVYLNQNMIAPLNSLLRNLKNKYLNNFLQNIFLMRNNNFFEDGTIVPVI